VVRFQNGKKRRRQLQFDGVDDGGTYCSSRELATVQFLQVLYKSSSAAPKDSSGVSDLIGDVSWVSLKGPRTQGALALRDGAPKETSAFGAAPDGTAQTLTRRSPQRS
jgi:hypothetical protein